MSSCSTIPLQKSSLQCCAYCYNQTATPLITLLEFLHCPSVQASALNALEEYRKTPAVLLACQEQNDTSSSPSFISRSSMIKTLTPDFTRRHENFRSFASFHSGNEIPSHSWSRRTSWATDGRRRWPTGRFGANVFIALGDRANDATRFHTLGRCRLAIQVRCWNAGASIMSRSSCDCRTRVSAALGIGVQDDALPYVNEGKVIHHITSDDRA